MTFSNLPIQKFIMFPSKEASSVIFAESITTAHPTTGQKRADRDHRNTLVFVQQKSTRPSTQHEPIHPKNTYSSLAFGANTTRFPLLSMALTTPAFSIVSMSRAALL